MESDVINVGIAPICCGCKRTPEEIGEYIDAAMDSTLHDFTYDELRGDACTRCGAQYSPELAVLRCPSAHMLSPTEYVRMEEGTYNPQTNHFCCTECYIVMGMPVGEGGTRWRAP